MRISGLHLRAYGHFTDFSLPLGQEPRLHLIYGDNEAGKSTTLRALSSVLFGYPHEVVDGFAHDPKDICIGADLVANDGSSLSFLRRRRGKNALSYTDGTALEESKVAAFLGGASKELFEKVFALDHHRLHQHARALLEEGGALGFSLAEAGSGVAGLKGVLDDIRRERTTLFLSGGTKPKLNQLISRLTELRKEARRRTVSSYDYKKRQKEINENEAVLQEARVKQRTVLADTRKFERISKNLPLRAEHEALSSRILELESVLLLPPEAESQRIKAQTDHDTAAEDEGVATDAINSLDIQIAAIVVDERTLKCRQDIERLAEQRAVIENAEKDLPKLEAERVQHCSAARDLLAQVELTGDPETLSDVLPSALKRKAISKLADSGTKLVAQNVTASANAEEAANDLTKAEQQLVLAPKPPEPKDLAQALVISDKLGDITLEISKRGRAIDRKKKVIVESIVGLGIADGQASTLRELVIPLESTVLRYKGLLSAADVEIGRVDAEIERFEKESATHRERIAMLKKAGDVATEEDLRASRNARDEGWAIVRALYIDKQPHFEERARTYSANGQIATTYERDVIGSDRVADVIRTHVKEATELSMLERQRDEIDRKTSDARALVTTLETQRQALFSEWSGFWPTGLITSELPDEMAEWMERRDEALQAEQLLQEETGELQELKNKENGAIDLLVAALQNFSPSKRESGLDNLRDCARQVLEDVGKQSTRHVKANEAVRAQTARKLQSEQSVARLREQIAEWNKQWTAALTEAHLPVNLTLDVANVVLDAMSSLDGLKIQIDSHSIRIGAMRNDRETFSNAVDKLKFLAPAASKTEPSTRCRSLEENLAAAKSAETELRGLQAQLKIRSTAREQARQKLERSKAVLDNLCAQAGCIDFKELPGIEKQSTEKQQAIRDRQGLETRIREDGSGLDLASLFAECEGVLGDQIAGEIANLKVVGDETETKIEQVMSRHATLTAEFDRLLAENQAADSMQAAANAESEISEIVETYVDLTVQEVLLKQAIDLYRDRNQGPILRRAKDLFAELTNGVYKGLRADSDERGEPILIAEHSTRGSLDVGALSDGTVDPLYLALRLAVVQEHNATHESLPFVADDLMLNLDNTRARAALKTLAKISATTQVLFFTHHAHMVELARSVVPKSLLVEHSLPGTEVVH